MRSFSVKNDMPGFNKCSRDTMLSTAGLMKNQLLKHSTCVGKPFPRSLEEVDIVDTFPL